MLKADFTRDLTGTYMLLSDPGKDPGDSFDLRILSTNRIPGLLPLSTDRVNGCVTCRCEITGLIPFDLYWEHSSGSEECVRSFYLDLIDKLLLFEDYLLDLSHVLLMPEYLYMQPDPPSIMAAYCPFTEAGIRSSLTDLTEHLLLLIGHRDRDGVILTCRILHELRGSSTELSSLKSMLLHENAGENNRRQPQQDGEISHYGTEDRWSPGDVRSYSAYSGFQAVTPTQGTVPQYPNYMQTKPGRHARADVPLTSSFESTSRCQQAEETGRSSRSHQAAKSGRLSQNSRFTGKNAGQHNDLPGTDRSRPDISLTASAEIRPEPGTLKMMLFSLMPAAAIYALLHIQTMFFLETEEMIAAALLVCAGVLAILTAIHPGGKAKGKNKNRDGDNEYFNSEISREDFNTERDARSAGRRFGTERDTADTMRDAVLTDAAVRESADYYGFADNRRVSGTACNSVSTAKDIARDYSAGRMGTSDPWRTCTENGSLYESLSSISPQKPCLIPERTDCSLPEIVLGEEEIVIGRSGKLANRLVPDPTVSRVHARVIPRDGLYCLEDLNSRKGTFVNGRLLSPKVMVPLTEGSRVSFGECRYIFHA